jgi:hypothetical protein
LASIAARNRAILATVGEVGAGEVEGCSAWLLAAVGAGEVGATVPGEAEGLGLAHPMRDVATIRSTGRRNKVDGRREVISIDSQAVCRWISPNGPPTERESPTKNCGPGGKDGIMVSATQSPHMAGGSR